MKDHSCHSVTRNVLCFPKLIQKSLGNFLSCPLMNLQLNSFDFFICRFQRYVRDKIYEHSQMNVEYELNGANSYCRIQSFFMGTKLEADLLTCYGSVATMYKYFTIQNTKGVLLSLIHLDKWIGAETECMVLRSLINRIQQHFVVHR